MSSSLFLSSPIYRPIIKYLEINWNYSITIIMVIVYHYISHWLCNVYWFCINPQKWQIIKNLTGSSSMIYNMVSINLCFKANNIHILTRKSHYGESSIVDIIYNKNECCKICRQQIWAMNGINLEQEHDNGKQNFCCLCEEINTHRTKIELAINFRHVNQNWLQSA